MRDHPELLRRKSVPLTRHIVRDCHAVLLATDHDESFPYVIGIALVGAGALGQFSSSILIFGC